MNFKSIRAALICLGLFGNISASAEYVINPQHQLKIGVGGYARVYTGKLESYQYNSVLKAEPVITARYDITDDIAIKGKFAYRIARNDRFVDKKTSRVYDAFGTIESETFGKLDIGKLRNVAYLMHQGSVDVSCMDVEDSDISQFYKSPKGFFAPTMTYLYTDARDPKISYTTPEWNGFKTGFSLVQSEDVKPDSVAPQGIKIDHGKGIIGGAQYKYNWNDDLWSAFSGGVAFYKDDRFFRSNDTIDTNHHEYSLGTKIGYKDLTVGMSYRRLLFPDKVALKDSSAVSMGIAYQFDKYAVSLSWLHSQAKHIEKDKYNHIMWSNRYTFNKYLEGYFSAGKLEFITNKPNDHKSWFGIMGLQLKI